MLTRYLALASVLSLIWTSGCGDSSGPVGSLSGKVTYKGEPVTEGSIVFFNPETGAAAEAQLDLDGTYVIETQVGGLPPGTYQVSISPPEIPDPSTPPNTAPSMIPKDMPNVPKKYRRRETSDLTVVIHQGENTYDLDMQD